jgi:hypothetical protein
LKFFFLFFLKRNFLEKIYEMIIDWTRDEEAKYQATLVAKEVDKFKSDVDNKKEKENQSASRSASRLSSKSGQKSSASAGKSKKK